MPVPPVVDGGFPDLAFRWEMLCHVIGDLNEGHSVDARQDEGLQYGVAFDLALCARSMGAAVIRDWPGLA